MEDVNEAVKAFNYHKKARKTTSQIPSPIEERMIALEEVMNKSIADAARQAVPVGGQDRTPLRGVLYKPRSEIFS